EGECTNQDYCDGNGGCHDNGFKPAETTCGSSADTACDNPDHCSGTDGTCVTNHEPDGTACDNGTVGDGREVCSDGTCQVGRDLAWNDHKSCTIDSCDAVNGCSHTPDPACVSSVTDSSLCTFDVDESLTGDQFKLIFTPDQSPSSWKLNASNPGQYYYNVFYSGSGNTTVQLTLPYPFVTQGAVPIHIYTSVTPTTKNGITC